MNNNWSHNKWWKRVRPWQVTFVLAIAVFCWWFGVSVFQYTHFLYKGFDLAIFDQVMWNTLHGRWFEYSFSPHSYLVDHRTWVLVLLLPVYAVWSHPLTLVFLMQLALVVAVIPLYRIAVFVWELEVNKSTDFMRAVSPQWFAFGVVVLYLLQPSLPAIAQYEFHALPFVIPVVFWWWLCVLRQRWAHVWILTVVLLLIREDVAFMVMGMGALLLFFRMAGSLRVQRLHGLGLILVGSVWFVLMTALGAWLSPEGSAKFFVFYDWMGETPVEALRFVATHPLQTFSMWLQYDHAVVWVFLLVHSGFLLLWAKRFLLPMLGTVLLYVMIDHPIVVPFFKTHFQSVVIAWTLIAILYGLIAIRRRLAMLTSTPGVQQWVTMPMIFLLCGAVLMMQQVTLSPYWTIVADAQGVSSAMQNDFTHVLSLVGPEDAVMASHRLYTHLSDRERLYPTLHVYAGRQHYSEKPYEAPAQVDWLLLETGEILMQGVNLPLEWRTGMGERFRSIIEDNELQLMYATEQVLAYGRRVDALIPSVDEPVPDVVRTSVTRPLAQSLDVVVNNDIRLLGWEYERHDERDWLVLQMRKAFPQASFMDDEHLELRWLDESGVRIHAQQYPIGMGVHPTHAWHYGDEYELRFPITVPNGSQRMELVVGPVSVQSMWGLSGFSPQPIIEETQSEHIELPVPTR